MSPAPLQISVEEHGSGKVRADLERMGLRAEDVLPTWPVLDALFRKDEAERFERQGPGWAKLADVTKEKKASLGQPPEIMRATETLFRSLTTGAGGEPGEMTGSRLVFGTDVPYARFHQFGTVKMPKRQVVGLSPTTRREMVTVLNAWIMRGAG